MAKNKSQYDSTLNLPKTLFEMRAGLPKKEPVMLKDWDDNDLYNQLMKHNEGKPQFILHDGPPYANGNIHMGTALNKIIKDIIIRDKNMEGFQAPYVPGFDTHGLPIELKALSSVGEKKKDISKLELRQICEKFATEHIDIMSDQFKRLGVIGDFEHPYLTLKPEFEARQIEIFGEMAKKGFFLGMAVCILLFAIWSYMHNTVKQEREVEKKLDARSLGAISYEWKYKTIKEWIKHRKKAVLVDNPLASFRFVESFKMLAARVEYHMSKINGKILVVTSVCENEGKSSVAVNLAITLAKKGKRVILIDGDIRCPAQYLLLGMSPKKENELGEFLNGRTGANNILLNTERKRLGFIGGKVSYSASTEMLGNRQLPVLIEACSKIVDYVIIDTPPSGMIGDAQILAQHADAVMVVARQNVTLAEDINEMMDDFRDNHTKVLGVVLNGVMTFQSIADSPVGDHYSRYGRYGRYGKYTNNKEV